jgi:hypothetical protein
VAKKKPPVTFEGDDALLALAWAERLSGNDGLHQAFFEEQLRKMSVLCEYYGIPPGAGQWYGLALALARELYPVPKKKGRTKWHRLAIMALVVEIERLAADPDDPARGAAWAAKQLATREPWRSFMNGNLDAAEALRKAYFGHRNDDWARLARDGFKRHEAQGTVDEWDAWVVGAVNGWSAIHGRFAALAVNRLRW